MPRGKNAKNNAKKKTTRRRVNGQRKRTRSAKVIKVKEPEMVRIPAAVFGALLQILERHPLGQAAQVYNALQQAGTDGDYRLLPEPQHRNLLVYLEQTVPAVQVYVALSGRVSPLPEGEQRQLTVAPPPPGTIDGALEDGA